MKQRSLIFYSIIVLIVYALTLFVPEGWATYLIAIPAYIVIGLTALARGNAIKEIGSQWDVRRMGFALAGATALMYGIGPLFDQYPSWRSVLIAWGVALVWLTTPNMIPWWEWMTGEWKEDQLLERAKKFIKSLFGK